jgi:hypothetical protein
MCETNPRDPLLKNILFLVFLSTSLLYTINLIFTFFPIALYKYVILVTGRSFFLKDIGKKFSKWVLDVLTSEISIVLIIKIV